MDIQERNRQYLEYVNSKEPKTKPFPSLLYAFLIGGFICIIGQGINDAMAAIWPTLTQSELSSWMSVILIFLTILLTGFGIFDRIGRIGGAGTTIPITGFANSIASSAMEFKKECVIYGICVKMFIIAGPVIVSAVVSSVVIGIIYLIF